MEVVETARTRFDKERYKALYNDPIKMSVDELGELLIQFLDGGGSSLDDFQICTHKRGSWLPLDDNSAQPVERLKRDSITKEAFIELMKLGFESNEERIFYKKHKLIRCDMPA